MAAINKSKTQESTKAFFPEPPQPTPLTSSMPNTPKMQFNAKSTLPKDNSDEQFRNYPQTRPPDRMESLTKF